MASLSLSSSTEIGLLHFDLATDKPVGLLLQLIANALKQTMKVIGRRFTIQADKRSCATSRRARYEMFNKMIVFTLLNRLFLMLSLITLMAL